MADSRSVFDNIEGALPRPEFIAELRARVEQAALAQSEDGRTAAADVSIVDPVLRTDDRTQTMNPKTKKLAVVAAMAAAIALIIAVAIWPDSDGAAPEVEVVDQPDADADNDADAATTTTVVPTTTTAPELIPFPDVARPDPAPPAAPSELDIDAWIAEFIVFAENRHEGDMLNHFTVDLAQQHMVMDDAFGREDAYWFATQCDMLPYTSSHLEEAPGLPDNAEIAAAYQELLDEESVRWAYQQAKCDAVDLDLVREGEAEFPAQFQRENETDFARGNNECQSVVSAIVRELDQRIEALCQPRRGSAPVIDRELPEDFTAALAL